MSPENVHALKPRRLTHVSAPMGSITTSFRLELVCIDYLHLEASCGGYEYILVVICISHKEQEWKNSCGAHIQTCDFRPRFWYPSKLHNNQSR